MVELRSTKSADAIQGLESFFLVAKAKDSFASGC
jgi:hypothetical protein